MFCVVVLNLYNLFTVPNPKPWPRNAKPARLWRSRHLLQGRQGKVNYWYSRCGGRRNTYFNLSRVSAEGRDMQSNVQMSLVPNLIQNAIHLYMVTRHDPYELAYVLKDNLEKIMSTPRFEKHVWEDLLFHDEFCDGVCVNTGQGLQVCNPHPVTVGQEFYSEENVSPPCGYAPDSVEGRDVIDSIGIPDFRR